MTDAPSPRMRRGLSLLSVAYFGLQLGAIARTHALEDDRFGFVMFHHHVSFLLRYHWIMPDGRRVRVTPKRWVSGFGEKFAGEKRRTTVMGLGAMRGLTTRYMEWLYENKRFEDAVALEATLSYRINLDRKSTKETLRWPPEGGD